MAAPWKLHADWMRECERNARTYMRARYFARLILNNEPTPLYGCASQDDAEAFADLIAKAIEEIREEED
jgi:hypothetical protein